VFIKEADPNDPTVGLEHPPGYPRGLWSDDPDGEPRYMSYELQYLDDARTVILDKAYLGLDESTDHSGADR
jgi:hypothetical protein